MRRAIACVGGVGPSDVVMRGQHIHDHTRAVLMNYFSVFVKEPPPTRHALRTANRRQPPTATNRHPSTAANRQPSCLDHEAESVPVNVRNPFLVSSPPPPPQEQPWATPPCGAQWVDDATGPPTARPMLLPEGWHGNSATVHCTRAPSQSNGHTGAVLERLTTAAGGGGGFGTRPRYLIVCLWRRLLAYRHCSF